MLPMMILPKGYLVIFMILLVVLKVGELGLLSTIKHLEVLHEHKYITVGGRSCKAIVWKLEMFVFELIKCH